MALLAQPRMTRCSAQRPWPDSARNRKPSHPPAAQSWNLINEPRYFANQTQCASNPSQCTKAIQGEAAAGAGACRAWKSSHGVCQQNTRARFAVSGESHLMLTVRKLPRAAPLPTRPASLPRLQGGSAR